MAYGYRNNGASLIVGLVQDYRNRAERKAVREEEQAYRRGRDIENDKRYDNDLALRRSSEARQVEQHDFQQGQNARLTRNQAWNDEANELHAGLDTAETGHVGNHQMTVDFADGKELDMTSLAMKNPEMMKYLNESRGNSGSGNGIFGRKNDDGSMDLYTKDQAGKILPFTVDPKDNASMSLKVAGENVAPMLNFVGNVSEEIGDNPELQQQHASNNAGLVTDEKGFVTVDGLQAATETDPSDLPPEMGDVPLVGEPESFSGDIAHVKESFKNGGLLGIGNEGIRQTAASISNAGGAILDKAKPLLATGAHGFYRTAEFLFGEFGDASDSTDPSNPKAPEERASIVAKVEAEVAKEPKAVQARLKLVMSDITQGIDQRPAIRKKIAGLKVKAGAWKIQQAENFEATGNPDLSVADQKALSLKSKKANVDLLKAQLDVKNTMEKLRNGGVTSEKAKIALQSQTTSMLKTYFAFGAGKFFPDDKDRADALVNDFMSGLQVSAKAFGSPMSNFLTENGGAWAQGAILAHGAMQQGGHFPKSVAPAMALSLSNFDLSSDKGKRMAKAIMNYSKVKGVGGELGAFEKVKELRNNNSAEDTMRKLEELIVASG